MKKDLLQTKPKSNVSTEEIVLKNESGENEEKSTFVFYNAGLGRRILAYLADIFIVLIASIFFFEILYLPLVRHCINFNEKVEIITEKAHANIDLMIDKQFMFFKDEESRYEPEINIDYTGDIFTKFYVVGTAKEGEILLDPLIHYWENVAVNPRDRVTFVNTYYDQKEDGYFEKYSGSAENFPVLKQKYVERWAPYFDPTDTVSDEILAEIKQFKLTAFRNTYNHIIIDFSKTNPDYISNRNIIDSYYNEFDFYYQITSIGAFLTVFVGLHVLMPLLDKNGRTLGKLILKLETVDRKNFKYIEKKWRSAAIFVNLIELLPIILFVPFISAGIESVFRLTILLSLSIIGAIFAIGELILSAANNYNLSVKQYATKTVVVDRDLMDQYYREVVYGTQND